MKVLQSLILCLLGTGLTGCSTGQGGAASERVQAEPESANAAAGKAARNSVPVVHVFVALCDNVNQGIVPAPPSLGNRDNPVSNLYWGAAFGVKTFFKKSKDWQLIADIQKPQPAILERCVFKHKTRDVFVVADAYRGKEIRQATTDFLEAASGKPGEEVTISRDTKSLDFNIAGSADLVAYVGHDGLMDFTLTSAPQRRDDRKRKAIVLACASKRYFAASLKKTGASPLLWTTNLMAPEAYVLSAAIDGWMKQESDEQIRLRAAKAYNSYQNCGLKSANNLFARGW